MRDIHPDNALSILLGLVALSAILLIVGLVLRRRGALRTRGAALGWAVLTIAPLFGSGFIMLTKHSVELATGKTKPSENYLPQDGSRTERR